MSLSQQDSVPVEVGLDPEYDAVMLLGEIDRHAMTLITYLAALHKEELLEQQGLDISYFDFIISQLRILTRRASIARNAMVRENNGSRWNAADRE